MKTHGVHYGNNNNEKIYIACTFKKKPQMCSWLTQKQIVF